jgi:hypothetical protein
METRDDLTLVFTGSQIQAEFIKIMLEDNKIGVLLRNTMSESLSAGWISGSQEDACRIYVIEEHKAQSEVFIKQYIESENNNEFNIE